mmetsp:Transcript_37403/g.79695  ORF Transcript_37403/g.79695 Transcript_37403/m.79695 type:complete len:254 (-) Transcript_37403:1456-2217(-)
MGHRASRLLPMPHRSLHRRARLAPPPRPPVRVGRPPRLRHRRRLARGRRAGHARLADAGVWHGQGRTVDGHRRRLLRRRARHRRLRRLPRARPLGGVGQPAELHLARAQGTRRAGGRNPPRHHRRLLRVLATRCQAWHDRPHARRARRSLPCYLWRQVCQDRRPQLLRWWRPCRRRHWLYRRQAMAANQPESRAEAGEPLLVNRAALSLLAARRLGKALRHQARDPRSGPLGRRHLAHHPDLHYASRHVRLVA